MIRTVIKGTGQYLPERIVTNHQLEKQLDTTDEWITKRTGIKERRWIEEGSYIKSSDLAYKAALEALRKAEWEPCNIDLIIFATQSSDYNIPSSAFVFNSHLNLTRTPTIEIKQHCSAFPYGLTIADAMLKSQMYKRILFVCAEVQSTGLDLINGRDVSVIFSDGAGCVCLEGIETTEDIGILGSILHADGTKYKNMIMGGNPFDAVGPFNGSQFIKMNGKKIYFNAVNKMTEVTLEVLDKCHISVDDIDLVLAHQANIRINESIRKKLGISKKKVYNNIEKYGNTSAATIPIALNEALDLYPNANIILFVAYGAGDGWGATIYKKRDLK